MGIKGVDEHLRRVRKLTDAQFKKAMGKALLATAQAIQADAQISIVEGSVEGAGHVPSRPGEPPNQEFGTLANHIEAVLVEPLHAQVSSNAAHSIPLEFGTSKMAARPFMKPATEKNRDTLRENVQAAVNEAVRKRG